MQTLAAGPACRAGPMAVPKLSSPSRVGCVLAPARLEERRPVKANFLGGLFGGGAIDDSKQYICVDCGYIYDGRTPFSEQPNDYKCPSCTSTKKRFKAYKGEAGQRPKNDTKARLARLQARKW